MKPSRRLATKPCREDHVSLLATVAKDGQNWTSAPKESNNAILKRSSRKCTHNSYAIAHDYFISMWNLILKVSASLGAPGDLLAS